MSTRTAACVLPGGAQPNRVIAEAGPDRIDGGADGEGPRRRAEQVELTRGPRQVRQGHAANADQRVLFPGDGVFAVLRETRDGRQGVLALTNVTALEQRVRLPKDVLGARASAWTDLVSGRRQRTRGDLDVVLRPYGVLWLTPDRSQP